MYQLAVVGLVAVILLFGIVPMLDDKVVFLDVGQGDAILLQNGTRQVLIDGGQGMMVLRRLAHELPWFDRTIEVYGTLALRYLSPSQWPLRPNYQSGGGIFATT